MKTLNAALKEIKYLLLGIVVVGALMVGCGSFNNIGNTYPTYTPLPEKANQKDTNAIAVPASPRIASVPPVTFDTGVKQVEATYRPCMEDPFPDFPEAPPVPTKKQIDSAGDSIAALELIERKQLHELRAYAKEVKKKWADAKQAYADKCLNPTKK